MRQAVILAGGLGTRLRARLGDLPKPMIPLGGKPLLEHHLELLRRHGFNRVFILACYRADLIEAHFGDGSRWGVQLSIVVEPGPLGTAGAVMAELPRLADAFLVLYGDTLVNVDLDRFWQAHTVSGAEATLFVHPNDHPLDSDLIETDAHDWVTAFHNRPHPPGVWRQNLVNAGLYAISRQSLASWLGTPGLKDFGHDLFPRMLQHGSRMLAYNSPEFIKDIGTPHRYDFVSAQQAAGVVAASSLHTPQKAVFLDRDGTLIVDVDGLRSAEALTLLPGAGEAVRTLNHHGWRAVVVTNQPVVAKGWCTEAELHRIHNKLETLLGAEHAFLDRIYHCPHHPESGHPGERSDLKIACSCRKPGIGMIQKAAQDLNLDLSRSWLIGDTTTDVQTAYNAGVRPLLVRTGAGGADGKYPVEPHGVLDDVGAAVRFIVANEGSGRAGA